MDDGFEPINLSPVYCISGIGNTKKKFETKLTNPSNTNSLIISILTKYAGDSLINLSDSKFIAMEIEITNVLTKYKQEIEMEYKEKCQF